MSKHPEHHALGRKGMTILPTIDLDEVHRHMIPDSLSVLRDNAQQPGALICARQRCVWTLT